MPTKSWWKLSWRTRIDVPCNTRKLKYMSCKERYVRMMETLFFHIKHGIVLFYARLGDMFCD